jgi:two-component system, OmpR family, phosphate regulon sensor histidine kinase PhoR
MLNSIVRKTLAVAFAMLIPPVVVFGLYGSGGGATLWLALASSVPGVIAAVLLAHSLTRQVEGMTAFVHRILEPNDARADLRRGGDELGGLSAALSDIVPKIDDLVERLRTELTRREAILASMTEGVVAVDAKLNITFCNRAFVQAVGERHIEEGGPLIKIVREPMLVQILRDVIDKGDTIRSRFRLSVVDGHSFEVSASPLPAITSRGAIAILHDVTPSEKLDQVRRDFIANVSHEFRTPLATIRGYAETLMDGGLEDEQNRLKFVEVIFANSVRLNNIAADLLTLTELEDGSRQTEAGLIMVEEVITAAIRAVEPAANLAGVRLLTQECPTVYVSGHRIRFEQALVNLLDNAVKFNKAGGEVRVEVSMQSEGEVEISVSDTGLGIPNQDLTRIFERFYRVDKARSRLVGGTGLGLSIVKHAVQQMNGTVTVKSELGKGSTFTLVVPAQLASVRFS